MKCPKCQVELERSGEADVDGVHFDVYQCDGCVVPWMFDGETFDVCFTFAIDASGRMIHPETLEPLSLN